MTDFEAVIRIKINSAPLEGELTDDWRHMLGTDLYTRMKMILAGQDDYGEVSVNIEDHRPRGY